MREYRFLSLAAAALVAGFVAFHPLSLSANETLSSGDIKEGHALVFGRSFDRILTRSGVRSKRLLVVFQRFDPPTPGARFGWWGEEDQFNAASVPPGRYHFRVWDDGNVIFTYQPFEPRYTVDIRAGEAVYIGDVITESRAGRFRMLFEEDREAAAAYFKQNFVDSGLTLTTRKVRRVSNEAILPQ
jgi:hypothetical protein